MLTYIIIVDIMLLILLVLNCHWFFEVSGMNSTPQCTLSNSRNKNFQYYYESQKTKD